MTKLKGIAYMRALLLANRETHLAVVSGDTGIGVSALEQFATGGGELPADQIDKLSRHSIFGYRKYNPALDEMVNAREGEPIEKLPHVSMDIREHDLERMVVLPHDEVRLVTLREGKSPAGGVGSSARDREEQRQTTWIK